jgi:Glycoside Hydrolase Family 113
MAARVLLPTVVLLLAPVVAAQAQKELPIRGITISTHGSGRDWGTDQIIGAMEAIKKVGATWACTHPYAGISRDGRVSARGVWDTGAPRHWTRPIKEAHDRGLKILIKPHLSYWGRFSWRGAIEFKTEEEWDRFFTSYETWIVAVAKACQGADGFVVGTELDKTTRFTDRWRRIIKSVRRVTKAPLTYAANWSDYQEIKFWNDLDVIGIQAYFPLAEKVGASEAEIRAGWKSVMARLHKFGDEQGKNIVFTELGYNCSHNAPVKPWEYREDGDDALPIQKTCLRAALTSIEQEPKVIGAFLWKWFPPPRETGHNFRLATPEIKALISEVWEVGSQGKAQRPRIGNPKNP